MAYVVDLEDDYAESDIPTTLIRSKADCPSLEVCTLNSMPLCFWGGGHCEGMSAQQENLFHKLLFCIDYHFSVYVYQYRYKILAICLCGIW